TGIAGGLAVIGLLAMGVATVAAGGALKFKLEYLFLAGIMASFIDDMLFEGGVGEWLEPRVIGFGRRFLDRVGDGEITFLLGAAMLILVIAAMLASLVTRWAYATALDSGPIQPAIRAGGISRFTWRGIRYPAGRRGPVLATMALQLRLAAERMPQQSGLLIAGAIALPFLPASLASFVAIYLPVIAAGIPAGIVGRTAYGKATGSLEGIATLPVPREFVALGTVLAIALAALPATGAIMLIRLGAGHPIPFTTAFAIWGLMAGSISIGNGMAAWFKPRHLAIVAAVAVMVIFALALVLISVTMSPHTATAAAIKLPGLALAGGAVGLLLLAPLGGALYGRGLERFELVRK
ncbi:MAG TPA: hypothetical protein PLL69_04495, partial [Gemmatimonadales bacterium]|nr:hypothetical protein [Gemmatimonadales bacterium]